MTEEGGLSVELPWGLGLFPSQAKFRLTISVCSVASCSIPALLAWTALRGPDLLQATIEQVILVEAEVMSKFVEQCGGDLIAERFFVRFRKLPEVLQEQNDLRWHRHVAFLGEFWSDEQTQCIRLDAVGDQAGIGRALERDRQPPRPLPQFRRQFAKRRLNFCECQLLEMFPIVFVHFVGGDIEGGFAFSGNADAMLLFGGARELASRLVSSLAPPIAFVACQARTR